MHYRLTTITLLTIIILSTFSLYSYSQSNKLVLPIGHTGRIYSAVFSPVSISDPIGGKFILTASDDNSMMLWRAEDGKLVRTHKSSEGAVKYACFSPDGKEMIAGTRNGTVETWDVASGNLVSTLNGNDEVRHLAVSPLYGLGEDDKYVIVCGRNENAMLRKLNDPSFNVALDSGKRTNYACFSPDGKSFLTILDSDPYINIWNVASPKNPGRIKVTSELVVYASFSPDGKSIVTCSIDDEVKVWDVASKKQALKLNEKVPEVLTVVFSPDKKWIATCSEGGYTKLFDATSGKKIKEWLAGDDESTFRGIAQVCFSPDGNYLLTLSGYNSLATWIAATGNLNVVVRSHTSVPLYAKYSSSGSSITTLHEDGSLKTWNANNGKLLGSNRKEKRFTASDYSPANTSMGSKYFTYALQDSIAYYQLRNASAELQKLVGHHDKINSICFSPDGNHIVTASNDSTAIIWKLAPHGNGLIEHILIGHKGFVVDANYSPDGKHIITSSYDRTAIVWNAQTGALEKRLTGHTREVIGACYSPNSKKIITTCWDQYVRIWNAATYDLLTTITDSIGLINGACFSPATATDSIGGKYVLTSGPGNDAVIWNAIDGKKLKELKGHTDIVMSANFSPDGKNILTSSYDNFCKVWDVATDSLLYNFIAIGNNDYLLTDNYGRFDGSANARQMVHLSCGTEIVELNQIKVLAWEPGLASKMLGNNAEPITAKKIDDINICRMTPEVITLPSQNDVYKYLIIPRKNNIDKAEVFVNNKLIKTIDVSAFTKVPEGFQLTINAKDLQDYFVAGGINKVDLNVTTVEGNFNARGVTLLKVMNTASRDTIAINLYIISVGISLYAGNNIKLNFASKDATDFSKALEIAARNLLNTDNKEHVFSYTLNTEPGNSNWPFKNNIKQTLDTIATKASANDIVVLFFAGHGVLPQNKKSLYLLTAEATSFDLDNGLDSISALSTDELISLMNNIKASKQVLILDACNSGQVIQNLQSLIGSRGDVPADQQRAIQNLQDKSGTYILSASASGQSAYESGIYNQGLLTYSLLYGLKLGDGLRAAKYIDLTKWFNNAASNVEILAKDIGGRQDPQIFGNASFDVGLVDNKLKEEIVLPAKKKVFGASLLIGNIDLLNDSLGLSEIVDLELMNRNALGKESKIAFAPNSKSFDTYYVKGRYQVKNDLISLVYFFYEDGNKKKDFHLDIPVAEKIKIGEQVAEAIETYFSGN